MARPNKTATAPATPKAAEKAAPKPVEKAAETKAAPSTANELAATIAQTILAELKRLLPIYARLAAADTIHTTQRPETVMRQAIAEGVIAAKLIAENKEI